jgi:hypothetical protein
MSAADTTNGSGAGSFSPPYGSWGTLLNTIERMSKEGGIPAQIDRSYLSNLPGSTQTELLQTMRSLGLIDEQMRPTRDLELLVEDSEGRGGVMHTILTGRYEGPLALGPFATQQQLEEEFRKYNIQGSTLRKAVRFFLAAAKYADISLSPHFRAPKDPARPRQTRRQPAAPTATQPQPPAPPKPPTTQHHPLIQGLFQELPPVGSTFTDQQQADWLALAKVAFKVIYKAPAGAEPDSPEDESGDLD